MKWNRKSKIMLLEQLEMYVSAGLTLSQALAVLIKRSNKKQAVAFEKIMRMTESGQSLSQSLSSEINLPLSIIGLISCGETSGSLSQALKASYRLLEDQDELVKKVISSMTYPIVIGLATVGLTIGLIQGVMPQIIPLLSSLHVSLPILTVVVMTISQWLMNYGLVATIAVALAMTSLVFAYKKIQRLRFFAQSAFIYLPIVGKLIRNYSLAVFFRSFGAMIEAGILADLAYEKAVESIGLLPLRRKLEMEIAILRGGEKFNVIAKGMPAYIGSLISAGEASGSLGCSLDRIATIIAREMDYALKRLTALVEPAMMIGMGGMVGSIALSIMMPIYDISKTLQH